MQGEKTMPDVSLIVTIALAGLVILVLVKTAVIVPQQNAYVVESLGRYSRTLTAGFNLLVPFLEKVAYKHSLKEHAFDIPAQATVTKDNVRIVVDGVLYVQVKDAKAASYGIGDYLFAISQLAQTTLRSEIGKIDLDKTFEERNAINQQVVEELDKATAAWGVKVLRYEIRNIDPPKDVLEAMEMQMKAERRKRAVILQSEGERQATINTAEGEKKRVVLASEAKREEQINEAKGEAEAIKAVASATADGLKTVAAALTSEGGDAAMQLRVAEQYVEQFGKLAQENNTILLPAELGNIGAMIGAAKAVWDGGAGGEIRGNASRRKDEAR